MKKLLVILSLMFFIGCDPYSVEWVTNNIPSHITGVKWYHTVTWYDGYAVSWVQSEIDQVMEFHEDGTFKYYGDLYLGDTLTSFWSYNNDTLKVDGFNEYYNVKVSENGTTLIAETLIKKLVSGNSIIKIYDTEHVKQSLTKR